jgi:Holliday junction resolvase
MATTPESKVKAKIKKILKDHGVYYAMPIGTGYGSSGVPDFLCCVNGNFLAIEAKAGKGTTTALQDKNIREIKESGGMAVVIAEEQLELGYLEQLIQLMRS